MVTAWVRLLILIRLQARFSAFLVTQLLADDDMLSRAHETQNASGVE